MLNHRFVPAILFAIASVPLVFGQPASSNESLETLPPRQHAQASPAQATKAAQSVTTQTFNQAVLKSDIPVLVSFDAPWCGPCRMLVPVIDEVARQYEGTVKVLRLNTDENPEIASQYGLRSIPTLILFKDGQRVDTTVGAVPKTTVDTMLKRHLD